VLHYYTLGKPKVIRDVCQQIFWFIQDETRHKKAL
jgi:hypothetical protein